MRIITASLVLLLFALPAISHAQSPGQIVKRVSVNTVLDPLPSTGYTSNSTSGFVSNDVAESRLPFKVITLPFAEPVGDLATGASGSFTDLVTSPLDKSGFMCYYDGTNLVFRLRAGSISSGAKGYSVLIDADNKAGNSGPQADPNYIAPTSNGNGNIGFEWEVLLTTGNTTRVTLYEVDGKTGPNIVQAYQVVDNNFQVSQAFSAHSNNPDYFFDFYLPVSQFSGLHAILTSSQFRMVATTVNSPTSALSGNRSDIFGVNDVLYPSTPDGWMAVLNNTPPVTLTTLGGNGTNATGYCTAAPTINGPINIGNSVTISGSWSRTVDAVDPRSSTATIRGYRIRGGITSLLGSTTSPVNTGNPWSVNNIGVEAGDVFFAKAIGTNESECLQSTNVFATCSASLNASTLTASSSKGICGSLTSGATKALIYHMSASGLTLVNANDANTTYTTNTFIYFACSGGTGNISNGAYMVVLTGGGCTSPATFTCITTGSSAVAPLGVNTAITINTLYPYHTSVSGAVPAFASPQAVMLLINGMLKETIIVPANTTSYSFNNLQLNVGDAVAVYATTSGCATYNSSSVVCYNQPPIITTGPNSRLVAGATTISGTSAPNAAVTVNKTNATIASYTTTANGSGAWSVTVPALVANDTYTASVTSASGCTTASVASPTATVATTTTVCPVFNSSSYTDNITTISGTVNVSVTGSIVRLYLDGSLIGSQTINTTGNQNWSFTLTEPLYNGGKLRASFQSGSTGLEKTDCAEITVTCGAPATPTISPVSATITLNQSVNYSIGNVISGYWYSLRNASSSSYSVSQLAPNTNPLSFTTRPFTTQGNYTVIVIADNLSGCPVSSATASVIVTSVLPAQFISVLANRQIEGVLVKWKVSNEVNVKEYIIERSANCSVYEPIGKIAFSANGLSENSYSFLDKKSFPSTICYRIRQVDFDGSYKLSGVMPVKSSITTAIKIAPNPAHEKINLAIHSALVQELKIEILSMHGQVVRNYRFNAESGPNNFEILNLASLPKGQYLVRVHTREGREEFKIILQ
jgi:hypothetical protein